MNIVNICNRPVPVTVQKKQQKLMVEVAFIDKRTAKMSSENYRNFNERPIKSTSNVKIFESAC